MNKAVLMGRLTRDPELRSTASGISVCSFTVAVDRRFKSEGQPTADFIPVIAWRQTADFVAKYFTKGSRIAVVGSIQTRQWDDKEGKRHYATEVVADEVEFCESKRNDNGFVGGNDFQAPSSAPAANHAGQDAIPAEGFYPLDDEGDIPF